MHLVSLLPYITAIDYNLATNLQKIFLKVMGDMQKSDAFEWNNYASIQFYRSF